MSKAKTCFETEIDSSIKLTQQGVDSFTVTYGRQVKSGLVYTEAAIELGAVIMHALACRGRVDNRTRAEARREAREARKQ